MINTLDTQGKAIISGTILLVLIILYLTFISGAGNERNKGKVTHLKVIEEEWDESKFLRGLKI